MFRLRQVWAFAVVLALVWQGSAPALSQSSGPDRFVVVFRTQPLPANASEVVQRAGGTVVDALPDIGVIVAEAIGLDGATLISRLRKESLILGVAPDRIVTQVGPTAALADSVLSEGHLPHPLPTFSPALPADFFYTSTPQQWAVKRIGAQGGGIPGSAGPGAWDVTFGAGVKVAVLDTGVSPSHPDIRPNLLNFSESFARVPLDPTLSCDDGSPIDQSGHGTWTASLIAGAKGIGTGLMIGVAPEAQILNIKVLRREPRAGTLSPLTRCGLGTGKGLSSWVLAGIVLAVEQGADIISMSLGEVVDRTTPDGVALWIAYTRAINHAVAAGALVVASGGENGAGGTDVDNSGPVVHLPSDAPNALTVVATTNPALLPSTPPPRQPCAAGEDCLAFYSNFGSRLRALAAPGGDFPPGTCAPSGVPCDPTGAIRAACTPGVPGLPLGLPPAGSFGCFDLAPSNQHAWYVQTFGTSASAALVAGAAALTKAANPQLTPAQIRTILQQTADHIGSVGYDRLFNFGLVNACRAVAIASNTVIACP